MKRRILLGGLAGGAIVAASGLMHRQWVTRDVVQKQSLAEFRPSGPFDVCVVGTGPAGCTLAEHLTEAGQRVLLLESGVALTDSAGMQKAFTLDTYSSSGELDYPLQSSRMRTLGGTSSIWTGRCPRMLPSDFSDNNLAPGGGWPVSYTELQPYYRAAEKNAPCSRRQAYCFSRATAWRSSGQFNRRSQPYAGTGQAAGNRY